jgi:hypothetical protein
LLTDADRGSSIKRLNNLFMADSNATKIILSLAHGQHKRWLYRIDFRFTVYSILLKLFKSEKLYLTIQMLKESSELRTVIRNRFAEVAVSLERKFGSNIYHRGLS